MTNAEWKELVAKEFGVSKSVARDMVSAMYSVYRRKKDTLISAIKRDKDDDT